MAALIQTLAVAEYLNFRHAANALGISQSSVSARIKALEEELGIPLFERNTRGVRLTEAGRHFVEGVATGIMGDWCPRFTRLPQIFTEAVIMSDKGPEPDSPVSERELKKLT